MSMRAPVDGSDQYFIRVRGKVLGPFTLEKLKSLRSRGQFSRVHEVSTDRTSWQPATDLDPLLGFGQAKPDVAIAVAADIPVRVEQSAVLAPSSVPVAPWHYTTASGERHGPVSVVELRDLIRRGVLNQDDFIWKEGMGDWRPISDVNELGITRAPRLTIEDLRDPVETTAFIFLAVLSIPTFALLALATVFGLGIPLLVFGLIYLLKFLGEFFSAAYIKTNAVRVSERQLPELYKIVETSARKLGIAPPEVYVLQESLWNAFAMRLAGRRLVVLLSGAVDSILLRGSHEQLAFLLGHELGHHAAGHLGFWTVTVSHMGAWLPWFLLWYRRRQELTCDRAGMYCAGAFEPAARALLNMSVGAQLAPDVSIDAAIQQWQACSHEFFVRYRTMYSHYPHNLWRVAALREAAGALAISDR